MLDLQPEVERKFLVPEVTGVVKFSNRSLALR